MNKTESQQKLFATIVQLVELAAAQHLLKLCFIVKIVSNYGIKAVAGRSTASGLSNKGRFKLTFIHHSNYLLGGGGGGFCYLSSLLWLIFGFP
jgi:hypothetical protein